jgi:uncharacterized protein (DUF736 family)
MSSQITCGVLKKNDEDDEFDYVGKVSLGRRLSGTIGLREHPLTGQSKKSPDYEVLYKHEGKPNFGALGSAWEKESEDKKTEFVSMSLDSPDWDDGLNLTAFRREDGTLSVVWSRPRGARVQDEAEAA